MRKYDAWLCDWADSVIDDTNAPNFSGINVVEKILRDPGVATGKSQHKVLWWPRHRGVARISKAVHQLSPIERIILIVHYGFVKNDDETRFTRKDLASNSSISTDEFSKLRTAARRKLTKILRGYERRPKKIA